MSAWRLSVPLQGSRSLVAQTVFSVVVLHHPNPTKSNSCMPFVLSENSLSKKNTILSTFWITGLLPFHPEIVLEQLREPEAPTRPTTPSPSPSSPHAPLTIRSLKRQANSLEKIRRTYHLLFSGSLEDLFVAVLRKTARCAGSRKSSTHASRSESACYEATRWQTYLEGPRSWWSALCT